MFHTDRQIRRITDHRSVRIDEVDLVKGHITAIDQYGTPLSITTNFSDPVISIPSQGETWLIERMNTEWHLKKRVLSKAMGRDLNPGDTRIDSTGDTRINSTGDTTINGATVDINGNDINVTATGDVTITGTNITITGDVFISNLGIWNTYVPTLHATSSNPVLGFNPTATGRYTKIGKFVQVEAEIAFGSGISVNAGSGTYLLSVPVTRATSYPTSIIGTGLLFDSSANIVKACTVEFSGSVHGADAYFRPYDSVTLVSNSTPWTWATNDALKFTFSYQAA